MKSSKKARSSASKTPVQTKTLAQTRKPGSALFNHRPKTNRIFAISLQGKLDSNSSTTKSHFSFFRIVLTWPLIFYALTLILLPLLYILFLSFQTSDGYGGVNYELTLENYAEALDPTFLSIFGKSILIGLIATFICLLISYPFAIFLRDKPLKTQTLIMRIVMIPFLTNSLIRTYGWVTLLRKHGAINSALLGLGIIHEPLSLMYNDFAIILGMVYTLLPFMILPVYSAVSKVDDNVLAAAEDLGASRIQRFFKVYLPLTLSGAFNGSLMVFIPAIGYFFIADILGGGKIMIIGNLIKNQFLTARNWPLGAALSILLLILTFGLVKIYQKIGGDLDALGEG